MLTEVGLDVNVALTGDFLVFIVIALMRNAFNKLYF